MKDINKSVIEVMEYKSGVKQCITTDTLLFFFYQMPQAILPYERGKIELISLAVENKLTVSLKQESSIGMKLECYLI